MWKRTSPHTSMKGMQNVLTTLKSVWQIFIKSGIYPSEMKTYVDTSMDGNAYSDFIYHC